MHLVEGKWDAFILPMIVLTIPMEVAVKIIVALVVVLATALTLAWHCCRGARPDQREPGPREVPMEVVEGKQKPPKKSKAIYCDAGIQGPVHFNGVRYVHKNQGFQRGDEVTRVVASAPHRG